MQRPASPSGGLHLTSVDDVTAAAWQCGSDAAAVQNMLIPALKRLCNAKQGQGAQVLLSGAQNGRDPLTVISPVDHSAAYVYILATRVTQAVSNLDEAQVLVPFIEEFAATCTAQQVVLAGSKVTELAAAIVTIAARGVFNPDWTLQVLHRLFQTFTAPNPGNFTTLHPILATYCLSIEQPQYAHEWVLSQRLVDASKKISPLRASDIIDYYYAGAQVYLQMHAYREAEEFLEACVTAPAQVPHPRLPEAAKRLVLVQLLKHGERKPLPNYTPAPIARVYTRLAHPYVEFADVYASTDRGIDEGHLQRLASKHQEAFEKDGLLPFIASLISMHGYRRIQRLQCTFTRLAIADVVKLLALTREGETASAAEARVTEDVQNMISSGQLAATLSSGSAPHILTFRSEADAAAQTFASLDSIAALTKEMGELVQWNSRIEAQERGIAHSHAYVAKQQSGAALGRMGPGGWSGGAGGMDEIDVGDDAFA